MFPVAVLDISDAVISAKFGQGLRNVAALSIGLNYGQGRTLVHFSAQLEPFLTQNTP
jgi:hypothetical protein